MSVYTAFVFTALSFTICTGSESISFTPFYSMQECFREINHLGCKFEISNVEKISTWCLRNITAIPVFKLVGEFNVLSMTCNSSYPLDSLYYGTQPTEAIFTEWWKEIIPNDGLRISSFYVKIQIYSVKSLFSYYNDIKNYYYEDHKFQPAIRAIDYSRSGNFTFPGIFNTSIGPSFYLFLEDSAKISILRNKNTISPHFRENVLMIPCVPSHYNPTDIVVELNDPNGNLLSPEVFTWNPVNGYQLQVDTQNLTEYYGNYTCSLFYLNVLMDKQVFYFNADLRKEMEIGLENFNFNAGTDLEFEKVTLYDTKIGRTRIYPACKLKKLEAVDTSKLLLISVPSNNFAKMRQVQQFALPEYYNQSYSAIHSRGENYDSLIRLFSTDRGSKLRMGTSYCLMEGRAKIGDYGASFLGDIFVNFAFGEDWAKFNRRNSSPSTHFQLKVITPAEDLYADSMPIKFSCKVNIPVVVPPLVWFIGFVNGTLREEFIDHHLNGEESIFETKLSLDTSRVYCFGSYWYSDYWRNVSEGIQLKSPEKPEILTQVVDFKYKLGSSQTIKCEANGRPMPEIYFERYGQRASFSQIQNAQNYTLLELRNIIKENYGPYICIAKNAIGSSRKEFTISPEDENEPDYLLFILLPLAVFFLTVIGAYVYIKFFRKEKTGLTKQEIEDFVKGLKENEIPGGDYAHDFTQMCPYTGEYEIPRNRFQIDTTAVIGSGAFGVVMKGAVDNQDVAIKTIKRNADKQYLKALLSELKIMIYLGQNPNLVTLIGAYTQELNKGTVYVFVKYFKHGNLESFLRQNKNFFTPLANNYSNIGLLVNRADFKEKCFDHKDLIKWCTQIADGMKFLGSKKVVHGDLATRNILLDANLDTKITDFGLSRQLYEYSNYVKKQQEPLPWRWMSLEALKFLSFSSASDVWAFGIVCWEIFSLGEIPYPGYSWTLEFVNELERGLRMASPKYATNTIYELLCECWHEIPEKRPSFQTLHDRFGELFTLAERDAE